MESTRCVRALLMYGADYRVKDKRGRTPKDITEDYDDEGNTIRISKMIDEAEKIKLKFAKTAAEIAQQTERRNSTTETGGGVIQLVQINKSKRTLREVERNYTTMQFYFFIYIITLFFRFFSVYAIKTSQGRLWWSVPIGIDVVGFILYFWVACKDPGFLLSD